ncbi:MAG: tetratricopeptide repeat protein [Clostridiaceae bacterium]|nr:tetratricopeptide repeat protein [Clostridiaceae bacterium]
MRKYWSRTLKTYLALYNVALAYNCLNQPLKAIKAFEFYLKNYTPNANVLAGLGYAFYLNRDIEKAKEVLEEAVLLEPSNIYALRNLSGVLAKLGDHEKAEKIFNDILQANPRDSKTIFGLGLVHFEKGEYDKAQELFYRVMALPILEEAKDPAREYLTKIAEKTLKNKGFRLDAVMYLVSAMNMFKKLELEEIRKITFEVASIGQRGFDINNPDTTYRIMSLEGKEVSGLCAVCYMYAGFKIIDPALEVGIDLSEEYEQARKLIDKGIM